MTEKEYQTKKYHLQLELLKWQNYVRETRTQHIIIMEGRDAAGKGGTIKRFMEHLNPRFARVVALDKPTDLEAAQWYWQRYINRFPGAGEITFWDRSWYNRAMVEPVMGFCHKEQTEHFLKEAPKLEQIWVDAGIQIIKFFLNVSFEQQKQRFDERANHPLKVGKLSPVDLASQSKWDEYTQAQETMFKRTSIKQSPWIIVNSDDKRQARIATMQYVLLNNEYIGKDFNNIGQLDETIIGVFNGKSNDR
jgi:polyphosphate kinase